MAVGTGIYVTWVTGAILISIALIPVFKPPYAKISLDGFIDMFRRYWAHMIVVFSVYLYRPDPCMAVTMRRLGDYCNRNVTVLWCRFSGGIPGSPA